MLQLRFYRVALQKDGSKVVASGRPTVPEPDKEPTEQGKACEIYWVAAESSAAALAAVTEVGRREWGAKSEVINLRQQGDRVIVVVPAAEEGGRR